MIRDLILKNRSYRRFDSSAAIDENTLREWVDLARHSASGANVQGLKYILSWTPEKNAAIFPALRWAGYLKGWGGPGEEERPTGYIVVLGDTAISKNFGVDHGIACQSILLGAVEQGFGGCIFGSIRREELRAALAIPEQFEILLVVALGKPVEQVQLDEVGADGSIKYWRDEQAVHHVPKRRLADLIL
ncbi:MAG: nitroreductase family protein [Anaerolineaceae bacterium]|jgi:nitroreductase|nr:nitroreductase family protein [Anaerolineaceae bacterium]